MSEISDRARRVIDRVLAVLETGVDPGPSATDLRPYAEIGDRRDGAGLTGGKHQATDRAGSLDEIVAEYAAAALRGKVERLDLASALNDLAAWLARGGSVGDGRGRREPDDEVKAQRFMALFHEAGMVDPGMRAAQDRVFERVYWLPAVKVVDDLDLRTALGHLVIYDTSIHSGGDGLTTKASTADAVWSIRRRFAAKPPSAYLATKGTGAGRLTHQDLEATWLAEYVDARAAWLRSAFPEGSPAYVSAYRCDALAHLISAGNWRLQLPLEVALPGRAVRIAPPA